MGAYGNQDHAIAGLMYGHMDGVIASRVVASGVTAIPFGSAVFAKQGIEDKAFLGDKDDATLVFAGVAIISQRSFRETQGTYPQYDSLNVMERGKVWVATASGVSLCDNKAAYVIDDVADAEYGKFTATSGANTYDIGCYFRSNPDNNLAVLEVRGLK